MFRTRAAMRRKSWERWNRKTISRRGAEAQRMKGNEIGSLLNVGTARMKESITLCVNGLEE
jgi:hypothetical protein